MKNALFPALFCAVLSAACLCAEEPKKPDLATDKDKASYAIGINLAQEIKSVVKDIDLDVVAKSFRDALGGKPSAMTDDEMDKSLADFRKFLSARMLAGSGKTPATPVPPLGNKEKISYALGQSVSSRLENFAEFLNLETLCSAFISAAKGEPLALNPAEHKDTIEKYLTKVKADFLARNKKQGDEFLAANKTKEGVTTTASGLQYKIIKAGNGEKPTATDRVSVIFEGRFINGKVFESSATYGGPLELNVDGTIAGLMEALRLMPTGSKWQIFIPIEMGYGEDGRKGLVPPNSVLVYTMELVSIKKVEPK